LNVYGSSKLAGEQAIQAAGGAHLIVRTSWVYAATGTNFLRTIARLAGEREELRIVVDQVGAPTSAAWIAEAVGRIFAQEANNLTVGFERCRSAVNIAAAGETSWFGFAEAIVGGLKRRGFPLKVRSLTAIATDDYPVRAKRPRNSRLDLSRLVETFAIRPPAWDALLERELDRFASMSTQA
jgi:dTDP-4-dehydrorhamnose reductase